MLELSSCEWKTFITWCSQGTEMYQLFNNILIYLNGLVFSQTSCLDETEWMHKWNAFEKRNVRCSLNWPHHLFESISWSAVGHSTTWKRPLFSRNYVRSDNCCQVLSHCKAATCSEHTKCIVLFPCEDNSIIRPLGFKKKAHFTVIIWETFTNRPLWNWVNARTANHTVVASAQLPFLSVLYYLFFTLHWSSKHKNVYSKLVRLEDIHFKMHQLCLGVHLQTFSFKISKEDVGKFVLITHAWG